MKLRNLTCLSAIALLTSLSMSIAQAESDSGIAGTQSTLLDNLPQDRELSEFKVVMKLQQGSEIRLELNNSNVSRDLLNRLPLRIDLDTNGAGGLVFSLNDGLLHEGDRELNEVGPKDVVYDPQLKRVTFALVDSPELAGCYKIGEISEKAVKTLSDYKPAVAFLEARHKQTHWSKAVFARNIELSCALEIRWSCVSADDFVELWDWAGIEG